MLLIIIKLLFVLLFNLFELCIANDNLDRTFDWRCGLRTCYFAVALEEGSNLLLISFSTGYLVHPSQGGYRCTGEVLRLFLPVMISVP